MYAQNAEAGILPSQEAPLCSKFTINATGFTDASEFTQTYALLNEQGEVIQQNFAGDFDLGYREAGQDLYYYAISINYLTSEFAEVPTTYQGLLSLSESNTNFDISEADTFQVLNPIVLDYFGFSLDLDTLRLNMSFLGGQPEFYHFGSYDANFGVVAYNGTIQPPAPASIRLLDGCYNFPNILELSILGGYCETTTNYIAFPFEQRCFFILICALYDDENWINRDNWFSEDISTWHGVSLDSTNTRIVALDLSNNNLSAVKDSMVWDRATLPYVTSYNLSNNPLDSLFPLPFMPMLSHLNVANGNLSSLPDFNDYPNLTYLNVSGNNLDFDDILPLVELGVDSLFIEGQDSLTLYQSDNTLWVAAGENASNNTYSWYKDGILLTQNQGDNTLTIQASGEYYCIVENAFIPNFALISKQITATFTCTDFIPIITGNTSICSGETTILDAGDFSSYLWSPNGETTQTIEAIAGIYTVLVSNEVGCTGVTSIEIAEASIEEVTISGELFLFSGETVVLTANEGFETYDWQPNGETTQSITVSEGGMYSVVVTNANGCTNTASVEVTENCPEIYLEITNLASQYCTTDEPVQLQGTPAGGVFSGTGISGDTLYPNLASQGFASIIYTYNYPETLCTYPIIYVVEIITPILAPTINCTEITTNSILFTWTDVSAESYEVTVIINGTTTETFIHNELSYLVIANSSDEVTIKVRPIGTGVCIDDAESIATCNVPSRFWPGDTNNDDVVNMYDLFPIGLAYGQTGVVAANPSIDWENMIREDWSTNFTDSIHHGLNHKYADCNGDGAINEKDTLAIFTNYSFVHGKTEQSTDEGSIQLYWEVADTIIPNVEHNFSVYLGTPEQPVDSIYSIAFTAQIIINDSLQVNEPAISFANSVLGTKGVDMLTIDKHFQEAGAWDIALTRIDQRNIIGHGKVVDINCTMEIGVLKTAKTIHMPLELRLTNVRLLTAAGNIVPVNSRNKNIILFDEQVSIIEPQFQPAFQIYPNPVHNQLFIQAPLAEKQNVLAINIVDLAGKQQLATTQEPNHHGILNIDVSNLSTGTYIISIQTENTTYQEKIIIVH